MAGPTWIAGAIGWGLHLDGTTARATIPNSVALEPETVTLAAWVRATGPQDPWRVFLYKGVTDCLASSYSLKTSGGGGLVFGVYVGGRNTFSPDAGPTVWDGTWHLAVGTYDGAVVRLFVDGSEVGTGTVAAGPLGYGLANGSDLVIGHPVNACGQASQFIGDLDEVQVWDRALTPDEVASLAGPPFRTGLSLVPSATAATTETELTITATVAPMTATGVVTLTEVVNGVEVDCFSAPLAEGVASFAVTPGTAGSYEFRAAYSGDAVSAPAISDVVEVTAVVDIAHASGVGASLATFYPVKDGYRDVIQFRGTPHEPLTVAVRIYDSSGHSVRAWTLSERVTPWLVSWNGRTAAGTLLPAARYRVVQRAQDRLGHVQSWTSDFTLSHKKLTWLTGVITKRGSATSDMWRWGSWAGTGASRFAGGIQIHANPSPYGGGGINFSQVNLGWVFKLPSALKYGTVRFSILGVGRAGAEPATISMLNTATDEEDGARLVGRSYAWYRTSAAGSTHVNANHQVWGFASVEATGSVSYLGYYGYEDIKSVRLTFDYLVLQ